MSDTKTATFVDKSAWERGPWDTEPDRLEWRAADVPGLPCLIVRNPLGSLCGYVGVPPGHPAHGKGYDDVPVNAHGGLTYADACEKECHRGPEAAICHVPQPGESDDVWWLGFDCGHAYDISPGLDADVTKVTGRPKARVGHEAYRDVAYVRAEVESLAGQLHELTMLTPP